MGRKLYVDNLGYGVTDSDRLSMFEPHGTVEPCEARRRAHLRKQSAIRKGKLQVRNGSHR
jgi:hypothetical protein